MGQHKILLKKCRAYLLQKRRRTFPFPVSLPPNHLVPTSPRENMMEAISHTIDKQEDFDKVFEQSLSPNEGDIFKDMMKDQDFFLIGQKQVPFKDRDPIFFRNAPYQNFNQRGMCFSCDVPFKSYKIIKYW